MCRYGSLIFAHANWCEATVARTYIGWRFFFVLIVYWCRWLCSRLNATLMSRNEWMPFCANDSRQISFIFVIQLNPRNHNSTKMPAAIVQNLIISILCVYVVRVVIFVSAHRNFFHLLFVCIRYDHFFSSLISFSLCHRVTLFVHLVILAPYTLNSIIG